MAFKFYHFSMSLQHQTRPAADDRTAIPEFPITAIFLKEKFKFTEGKELGFALKKLEKKWLDSNFKINKDNIKNYLNL